MKKLKLLLNTIKHLTFRQIIYRIYYMIRKKIHKKMYKKAYSSIKVQRITCQYSKSYSNNNRISYADGILKNEFHVFPNKTVKLVNDDWNLKNNSYRLVCFRFNSFEWLFDLKNAYDATSDEKYVVCGIDLIKKWWSDCGKEVSKDKWNAYVNAARIMNWIGFASRFANDKDLSAIATMISFSAKELSKSVEYQLGANHLLSEAKSLMFAGFFLSNKKIYDQGKKILIKEFNEQFLDDGGHFERSISYHVESLQQYFEAIYLMKLNEDLDYKKFVNMVKRAYIFLNSMIEVDGNIPLLNDAAFDYPFDARDFLYTANYLYKQNCPNAIKGEYSSQWEIDIDKETIAWNDNKTVLAENTGILKDYFKIGDMEYDIVFDVGNNGPYYNQGHAHADALSITLTSNKKRILVDAGVFTYENNDMRLRCRSTKAHNTIEIDGKDSAEVWGAFRVAKRGKTNIIYQNNQNDYYQLTAVNDSYKKILKKGIEHKRSYLRNKDNCDIIISDFLYGKGMHEGVLRFHIGNKCKCEIIDSNSVCIDENIVVTCTEKITISDSEMSEDFGQVVPNLCIEAKILFYKEKDIVTKISFRRD